jgi:membrane fusion protein, heavy metal efflux system
MKSVIWYPVLLLTTLLVAVFATVSCGNETQAAPTKAEITLDPNLFQLDDRESFKLVRAETRQLPTQVTANGTVTPDVNRTIHVTSMGSGRVLDLKVRLGDSVRKGQTLLVLSSPDLASANADFQKARADEELSRKALDRAQLLYSRGALAEKDLQLAQDAEDKAKVDVSTAEQKVRVIGGDPGHPDATLTLRAPVAGTIVEQNVAGFEGVKSLDNTPNLFTIADLSQVWVLCDVFENDLGEVHLGDSAEIRLNAFPDRVFHGKVADISRVLDPSTRSAKVRIVMSNQDGSLRPGMFASATLRSRALHPHLIVPTTAIMRLHDKDWVFAQESLRQFRKLEVRVEPGSSGEFSQLQSGLKAGQSVVADALQFSTEVAEKK